MPLTSCTRCTALYEAGEESGNEPGHLCPNCWKQGWRRDSAGNVYPPARCDDCRNLTPADELWQNSDYGKRLCQPCRKARDLHHAAAGEGEI